jgi:alpha-L-fucosidase
MNRRNFLSTTTSSLAASSIIPRHSFADDNVQDLPKPSTQEVAWQDCELGMFFHFDTPVFKPGWDWRSWKDLPGPKLYDPQRLETDQWLQAASSLGAKYAVLVAKHCSGFLQWQSDLYPMFGVGEPSARSLHARIRLIFRDYSKVTGRIE